MLKIIASFRASSSSQLFAVTAKISFGEFLFSLRKFGEIIVGKIFTIDQGFKVMDNFLREKKLKRFDI